MDGSNFAFSSTPGGGIYCNNSLYNVTNITASGTVQGSLLNSTGNLSGVGITLSGSTAIGCSGYSGSNPYIIVVANFNPNWNQMSLQGLHYPGVWAGPNISIGDGNSVSFRNGGTAFKSGGASSWDGWSDARIKDIKGDYISSLDAVAALRPVRFTYKGNDTYALPSNYSDTELDKPKDNIEPTLPYANSPNYASARDQKEYVGLIAQEAELAMPELFFQTKAYIDGTAVDDLRNVNYSALTFALVNAIKELKARIEQLEGKDG
jgi:hypothetical protein